MKFSRLRITGFKSFCDATELHLEPGLSGVVGPNGCGKSNLVEAMRWVMGESSYKAMRASGMDDVIFAGSGNRPARNTAEVTLVLDNQDRTAPAALNNADILEVTRRIERENGSVYRVNGREVRARDVQLLFADASTGAQSPAMVRQGQIGELIAAKPVKRRALLEEAAGISGLHSRRHEAELRLKAAEQNLERVDDIIGQVEQQLDTLKRQARLATRYRNLSGDIRRAEATLYHLRWVAARFAEKETEAQQGKLITQLAEATSAEHAASKKLEEAEEKLQPLREAEAKAGAVLQRLKILSDQLQDEVQRADARRAELEDRGKQAAQDAERERVLFTESEAALERYKEEASELLSENENEREDVDAARSEVERLRHALAQAETQARAAADALAQLRAQGQQSMRAAEDARQRLSRVQNQVAEIEAEAKAVQTQLDADETVAEKTMLLEAAQERAAETEEASVVAEAEANDRQTALEEARPALVELDTTLSRLVSEADTLSRILNVEGSSDWPSLVDALKVSAGYETALGAALGDDLEASTDINAPLHWDTPGDDRNDPALPNGALPLTDFVSGVSTLTRRLNQIGLVDRAEGTALMGQLKPGQRLVSIEGDLWRWDGFVAAADAPTAAAQRLAQRNRLVELAGEIETVRSDRARLQAEIDQLATARDAARAEEKRQNEAFRLAQRDIAQAQQQVDAAQKALGQLTSRKSALEQTHARLLTSLEEAEAALETAMENLAEAESEEEAAALAENLQAEAGALRDKTEQARLRLSGFENAARLRESRHKQITAELESWQRRRDSAHNQLTILEKRQQEIAEQLTALNATPDGFAQRRARLDDEIEDAKLAHKTASDRLAESQTALRETDRAARDAANGTSRAREELARVDERLKGLASQRLQIERLCQENLSIPASKTAEVAGLKTDAPLPREDDTERKVDRLKLERERLGGVNLGAEREAEEVAQKLETMVTDREDLIAAIAKLRTGISNLNREGRARLNEAFVKVNGFFQELFTSLFGGGTAELQFVESDDPLQAGLEIIARPPGKKPQTMTLLSGGEQALTAMSLIFAVFLTNPAPICVLDEVDAPLDDANVERFCTLLDTMRKRTETRFVVITHNPITMARMDRLFGVTMAERGVSQLVSVDLRTARDVAEVG